MAKILLVDDDPKIADLVQDWLKAEGHMIELAATGGDASSRLRVYEYDLIILDRTLPDAEGSSICSEFRGRGGSTPILMLTGKRLIEEKQEGFDAGADDYLVKPFNIKELSMRVNALLRRPAQFAGSAIKLKNLVLDSKAHTLSRNGRQIVLLPRDFKLLEFLMRHPDQFFTAEALIERVWPADAEASPEALRQAVRRLRKKVDLQEGDSLITSVHGLGYKIDSH